MKTGPFWVYAIRNAETGERLLGGAADVERAWRRHRRRLNESIHTNLALQEAWDEYGPDAFIVERLEAVDERAALLPQVHAWEVRVRPTYNDNWYPRLRPRVHTYRLDGEVQQTTIFPPTVIQRIERDEAESSRPLTLNSGNAPESPVVVAQTTYRLPFSTRDLPLVLTASGIEYVPVEAWCAVLGVRLRTHLWRLRGMLFWREARELALVVSDLEGGGGAMARSQRGRADRVAESRSDGKDTAPVWCLPRQRFLLFAIGLGSKWVDVAIRSAIEAMLDEEMAQESQYMRDLVERQRTYGVVRRRALDILLQCHEVEEFLRSVENNLAPRLVAPDGAELMARCAHGCMLTRALAVAAQAVFAQLHTGGLTEFTAYDQRIDAMGTHMIPNNPTLPDEATIAALDACEKALAAWMPAFTRRMRQYLSDDNEVL
jgi:hypothetical protein